MEIVTIAAWFHDSGYTDTYAEHEEKGKELAEAFLRDSKYDLQKITKVLSCIDATKIPQNPKNLTEQVICDADQIHFGKEDFFEYSDLLKSEWDTIAIKQVDAARWHKLSVELLSSHKYFTAYVRKKFEPQQAVNLLKAQKNYKKKLQQLEE